MNMLLTALVLSVPSYTHEISHDETRLTVRDELTGEVIWWRTVASVPHVSWTPDRRAMVAAEYSDEFIVWRAGERVRTLSWRPKFYETSYGEPPGPEGSPAISADGRFAAFLIPATQGSSILESYGAFIVDLDNGRSDALASGRAQNEPWYFAARAVNWLGPRELLVTEIDFLDIRENSYKVDLVDRHWIRSRGKWKRETTP